jgi:hypothetical protein
MKRTVPVHSYALVTYYIWASAHGLPLCQSWVQRSMLEPVCERVCGVDAQVRPSACRSREQLRMQLLCGELGNSSAQKLHAKLSMCMCEPKASRTHGFTTSYLLHYRFITTWMLRSAKQVPCKCLGVHAHCAERSGSVNAAHVRVPNDPQPYFRIST